MSTQPSVFEAQNTTDARRLVAAQSRIYSDAKILLALRICAVVALAIAAGIAAAQLPAWRTIIGGWGGVGLLLLSIVVGEVEKRLRLIAAATQETFDTNVFQLEWNSVLVERPPMARVAKAAMRYDGGRDANWYEDTEETHRPYDVLICQASNLGWGASMHRLWAWILSAFGLMVGASLIILGRETGLSWSDILPVIVIPGLAPVKELVEQIRANLDNARAKEAAERKISDFWARGMNGGATPSEAEVRAIQDKILQFRQTNAFVPDWLDNIFHSRNEAAMRAGVQSRVEEARRKGLG